MQDKKLSLEELGRIDVETYKSVEKLPLVVILDNVRSMHNVGSVFRTSDAFRVEKIMLCGFTPQPPHRDIRKVALGATESVDWEYFKETVEAIKALKENGYTLISIEQTANCIDLSELEIKPNNKYAVVFGNEVDGVAQEVIDMSDHTVEIAQYGTKHSLNVSVCSGIVIWNLGEALRAK